jgi:UDP-glucose 4-epimerase
MAYLVTGGAGFIGSHVCERLLIAGGRVFTVDNLSTGSFQNIAHLKSHPDFSFYVGDICDAQFMEQLVQKSRIVIHLAAAVGVKNILHNPVETLESNVTGTKVVLGLSARYNRRAILASTSEVYGKSANKRFPEDDDLVMGSSHKKRWGYACSKLLDEFLALAYFKQKGLPVTIIRMFNTVGPRQTGRYGMVLPTFIRQALRGEPITVFGTGQQSRCFCHVEEVVEAILALLNSQESLGQTINLGNTHPITIMELARLVKEITQSPSEIVTIPYDQAYHEGYEDMAHRIPDISKAQRLIGFNPQKSEATIIQDILAWNAAETNQIKVFLR